MRLASVLSKKKICYLPDSKWQQRHISIPPARSQMARETNFHTACPIPDGNSDTFSYHLPDPKCQRRHISIPPARSQMATETLFHTTCPMTDGSRDNFYTTCPIADGNRDNCPIPDGNRDIFIPLARSQMATEKYFPTTCPIQDGWRVAFPYQLFNLKLPNRHSNSLQFLPSKFC